MARWLNSTDFQIKTPENSNIPIHFNFLNKNRTSCASKSKWSIQFKRLHHSNSDFEIKAVIVQAILNNERRNIPDIESIKPIDLHTFVEQPFWIDEILHWNRCLKYIHHDIQYMFPESTHYDIWHIKYRQRIIQNKLLDSHRRSDFDTSTRKSSDAFLSSEENEFSTEFFIRKNMNNCGEKSSNLIYR